MNFVIFMGKTGIISNMDAENQAILSIYSLFWP
jgi:hypothetical protein